MQKRKGSSNDSREILSAPRLPGTSKAKGWPAKSQGVQGFVKGRTITDVDELQKLGDEGKIDLDFLLRRGDIIGNWNRSQV